MSGYAVARPSVSDACGGVVASVRRSGSTLSAAVASSARAWVFQSARALEIASEHYDVTRQAFSHNIAPASSVALALGVDMLAKVQHLAALFTFHQDRALLRRVTADRESALGY